MTLCHQFLNGRQVSIQGLRVLSDLFTRAEKVNQRWKELGFPKLFWVSWKAASHYKVMQTPSSSNSPTN